jgi:hypothetical protein
MIPTRAPTSFSRVPNRLGIAASNSFRSLAHDAIGPFVMARRPRFTLKGILGVTAALSVLSALIAARSIYGLVYAPLVLAACIGYLVNGWKGFWIAFYVLAAAMFLVACLFAAYLAIWGP